METCSITGSVEAFSQCLTWLPIVDLLVLEKSLTNHKICEKKYVDINETKLSSVDSPKAVKSPWYSDRREPAEKSSKLQTLFQISITALAFLSFGGYLLCLIVQGIKSKGTTYLHAVPTAVANINTGFKRIKVYRRNKRCVKSKSNECQ